MRIAVLTVLAACGRIGFDPTGDGPKPIDAPAIPITNLPTLTSGPGVDWVRRIIATPDGYLVAIDAGAGFAIDGAMLPFRGATQDAYVVSLDPTGAMRWFATCGSSGDDLALVLATDPDGNVYLGGGLVTDGAHVPGTGNLDCGGGPMPSADYMAYVASFTATGAFRWAHTFPSADPTPGMEIDSVRGIAWVGNRLVAAGVVHGHVDFGGGTTAPLGAGSFDGFVLELDTNGGFQNVRRFGPNVLVRGLAAATDGSFYIAGEYGGTVDFGTGPITATASSAMLVAFDAQSTARWSRSIGDMGTTAARSITVAANDDVYTFGVFDTRLTNGNQLVALGALDGFVAEHTPTGVPVRALQLGSSGCEFPRDIIPLGSELAIGGWYTSQFQLGSITVPPPTNADGFLATIALDGTPHAVVTVTGALDDSIEAMVAAPNGILVGTVRNRAVSTCDQGLIFDSRDATLDLITP